MSRLADPAEHGRLLEARGKAVAATWRRARRAAAGEVAPFWSDDERALLASPRARTVAAPLVALAGELDDLTALQARFADHRRGDPDALEDLVGWFLESEQVRALMPTGRLPRDPAPAIRRLLDGMKGDLVGRLVIQHLLDAPRAPSPEGAVTFRMRLQPSWGHGSHSLLLGQGRLLVGAEPIPARFRCAWDASGYRVTAPGIRIEGAWARPGACAIHAPKFAMLEVPRVGDWPLLPPVVDEDGSGNVQRFPAPGDADHAASIFRDAAMQSERIAGALSVLRAAWPEGARTVEDFTVAIIPVTQNEVVSYSFAPVPGWSYLNLYDRDFVDLIDDLVHENAHHHLNHILSDDALLSPPSGGVDESLIYYSPWRETLRPLRGILHSVFTFSAGAELFRKLWRALDGNVSLPHRFTVAERRKIALRCLEETAQVRYSLADLAHAERQGRISARGATLIAELVRKNRGFDRLTPSLRRAIAGTRAERKLDALIATLAERSRDRRRYADRAHAPKRQTLTH